MQLNVLLIHRAQILVLAFILSLFIGTGCATFQSDDDALAAYEQTRRRSSGEYVDEVSYEEEDGISVEDFTPSGITNNVRNFAGYGPDQEIAQQLFDDAKRAFDEGTRRYQQSGNIEESTDQFVYAGETFFDAAKRWPDSRLEQDALFYSGESFFFADKYVKSNTSFELLINRYAGTHYLDVAQARRFSIAQYWLELNRDDPDHILTFNVTNGRRPTRDTEGHAIRILNRMRLDDPRGRLADDATMALANAYFAEERFLDAADTYEDLRIAFPTSKHQYEAHLLELRARLQAYQGSAYDGTHLKKAESLLNAIVRQFPTEIERDRSELGEVAAEVRFRMAERDMKMARYYDYSGQHRSATIYYQQVVDRFEGTPQADEARERIAAIADEPAAPSQRAQWLVDLFPDPEATKPLIATSPTQEALR